MGFSSEDHYSYSKTIRETVKKKREREKETVGPFSSDRYIIICEKMFDVKKNEAL